MLGKYGEFNFINLKNEKNPVRNVVHLIPKRMEIKGVDRVINAISVTINFFIP